MIEALNIYHEIDAFLSIIIYIMRRSLFMILIRVVLIDYYLPTAFACVLLERSWRKRRT